MEIGLNYGVTSKVADILYLELTKHREIVGAKATAEEKRTKKDFFSQIE